MLGCMYMRARPFVQAIGMVQVPHESRPRDVHCPRTALLSQRRVPALLAG
eukprot:COSAG06_NODE_24005_length_675_cov_1.086806_2_plen_49_part_01